MSYKKSQEGDTMKSGNIYTKIIKRYQTEILELKNSMKEMKEMNNAIETIDNRSDQIEEKINDLESKNFEGTEKRQKNKNLKRAKKACMNY